MWSCLASDLIHPLGDCPPSPQEAPAVTAWWPQVTLVVLHDFQVPFFILSDDYTGIGVLASRLL